MKAKKLIILIAILGKINGMAQNCVQEIRTKPDNPVNGQMEALYPSIINPWKNTFNVGAYINQSFSPIYLNPQGWAIPFLLGTQYNMTNPFDGSNGYAYLSLPGQNPGEKDFHWEDGWELMWLGTGFYPNGEAISTANSNRIYPYSSGPAHASSPYMIYYNRYTGRLRIFANIFTTINDAYDDVITFIGHPEGSQYKKSGIFRHITGYDQLGPVYQKLSNAGY